jgi:hypothetical protein
MSVDTLRELVLFDLRQKGQGQVNGFEEYQALNDREV